MKTLIIIPTYNENQNIAILLDDILNRIDKTSTYILVVDDNSEDGTAETVKRYMLKHENISLQSRPGKLGLASAYIGVFRRVQSGDLSDKGYEALIMMDADLSHPPEYLPEIIEKLKKYDLVNGSRYIPGGEIRNWPFRRRFLSRFGNIYVRMILQTGIKDMSTGYVGFKISGISNINLLQIKAKGYAFLSEMKYLFTKLNFKVCEIPIIFSDRINGDSKLSNSIIKEGLIMPWQIRFKKVKEFMNPVKCNLCGETADFSFNKNGFNLYKCRDCQFIQVHPKVDDKILEDYYSETYSGDFYSLLNEHGYKVPNKNIFEQFCKKADFKNIKVFHGTIKNSNATNNEKKYDAIVFLDIFEQMDNPISGLQKVKEMLTPDGLAIIITPNTNSFTSKFFGRFWSSFILPQKVNYFNTENIKILAQKQNWKIKEIIKLKSKMMIVLEKNES